MKLLLKHKNECFIYIQRHRYNGYIRKDLNIVEDENNFANIFLSNIELKIVIGIDKKLHNESLFIIIK